MSSSHLGLIRCLPRQLQCTCVHPSDSHSQDSHERQITNAAASHSVHKCMQTKHRGDHCNCS